MTFRNDDDDTSPGAITQGGSTPRRGNSIFWAMGLLVIILAVLIAVVSLPKKHSAAQEGTAPVSTMMNATGPSSRSAPALAPSGTPPATAAPASGAVTR